MKLFFVFVLLFFFFFNKVEERVSLGSFKTRLLKFPGLPLPARDKQHLSLVSP